MGLVLASRLDKQVDLSLTFDGVTYGTSNQLITLFNITGQIWILDLAVQVNTTLVSGGSATLALGTPNVTGGFIAATAYTQLTAGKYWEATSGGNNAELSPVIGGFNCCAASIQLTLAGSLTITAGGLLVSLWYHPLYSGGAVQVSAF